MIYFLPAQTHKKFIFDQFMYNVKSILVLMKICMFPLKVYGFSEQVDQIPMKMDDSSNPAFKTAPQLLTEMIEPQRLLQPRQKHYCKFSQGSKINSITNQQEVV